MANLPRPMPDCQHRPPPVSLCVLVALGLNLLAFNLFANDTAKALSGLQLVEALQAGGYNLYFRHEATDWSQVDKVSNPDDWLSCDPSRIRQLSEQGRQRARQTGQAMREFNIPVAQVLASPYCRTVETAQLMGFAQVQPTNAVINLRVADYFAGRDAVVKTARSLLSSKPQPGSNRVIVAHGNIAREATPVYPEEGEGIVFQPNGHSFSYIGRIKAADWKRLRRPSPH